MLSPSCPIPELHWVHSQPRKVPVVWQWSRANCRLPTCFSARSAPQHSHLSGAGLVAAGWWRVAPRIASVRRCHLLTGAKNTGHSSGSSNSPNFIVDILRAAFSFVKHCVALPCRSSTYPSRQSSKQPELRSYSRLADCQQKASDFPLVGVVGCPSSPELGRGPPGLPAAAGYSSGCCCRAWQGQRYVAIAAAVLLSTADCGTQLSRVTGLLLRRVAGYS